MSKDKASLSSYTHGIQNNFLSCLLLGTKLVWYINNEVESISRGFAMTIQVVNRKEKKKLMTFPFFTKVLIF